MRIFVCCFVMCSYAIAAPPVDLVAPQVAEQYRQAFPAVDDAAVANLLLADDLIFYTENEIPKAYQHANSFHNPMYNIAAQPDPFGNGNREFPWADPGGITGTTNVDVFRFVRFPKRADGTYWPVVYWNQPLPDYGRDGNGSSSWRWRYPNGTVFGELLGMRRPNKFTYAFELRLRTREGDQWAVDVFRPFPTAKDMASRIKELRPNWKEDAKLVTLMQHLEGNFNFQEVTVRDNSGVGFNRTVKVHPLPPIDDDQLVAELLVTTRWKSALGEAWKQDATAGVVNAPTVVQNASMHIVPTNYGAHAFGADREECMNCHKHTNAAVAAFSPNREWYGRIRGSDGIFSFHPWSRSSISPNGTYRPVRLNPLLYNAGLVERYNQGQHPASVYPNLDATIYAEGHNGR